MRRACAMLRRAADISYREHSRLSVRECNQPHAALEPPHESAACDHRATVVHRRSQSYVIAGSPPRLALIPLTPLQPCAYAQSYIKMAARLKRAAASQILAVVARQVLMFRM